MRALKLILLFHLPYLVGSQTLGFALEQLESNALIEAGLNGQGVKIGIVDGGFLKANTTPSLRAHFEENRVVYYKDFVTPQMAPYGGTKPLGDDHGTEVWELIGGYHPDRNIQHGLATKATYYLARTDYDAFEKREEERYLIQAMAEMIAKGVRLFNVSLGYTNEYTNPAENYTPEQMDGKSTWITRSLDSLLAMHDVLVIVAAGNDGDLPWRTISAPADSKNVIAVGATKLSQWEEMDYSSIGPEWLDYVKPDVSSFSTIGTSYSAPVITGLAACLMQYDSSLRPAEIKDLLMRAGHLYPYPNNHLGYGVPTAPRILELLQKKSIPSMVMYAAKGDHFSLNVGAFGAGVSANVKATVYHKSGWYVIKKETIRGSKKLRIDRPEGCDQSTVVIGTQAIEIQWEH